jgi:hypothetical protein
VRCVSVEGLPDGARPDDNYFDLHPDVSYEVRVRGVDREPADLRIATGLAGAVYEG